MANEHHLGSPEWQEDCQRWWGRILTGEKAHWCADWDFLPVDETTTTEFECCTCYPPLPAKDGRR